MPESASRGQAPEGYAPIPVEQRRGAAPWALRCVRTLVSVSTTPHRSFERCPEPVEHTSVLGYLATLRLLPWVLLITWLGFSFLRGEPREAVDSRAIDLVVDPALGESLATWLLLMVPVGMPLLYFGTGLLAHIGVALTGGAARSIGASMRATGYALGPALLGIAWFDVPLYTIGLDAVLYGAFVLAAGFVFFYVSAVALARTHQMHIGRGLVVSLLPLCLLVMVTGARGALILDDDGLESILPQPASPYWVP